MKTICSAATTLLILFMMQACKKNDLYTTHEVQPDKAKINLVKNWYNTHKPVHSNNITGDSTENPKGDPEWDSTHSYTQSQITYFVIPMRFDQENSKANQFVLVQLNANNDIIKTEYAYLLLDQNSNNNYSKEQLETLSPEVFDFNNIPTNLKASLVKYDFNNGIIAAKHISNSTAENKDLDFKTTPSNFVPMECGTPVCIDWYWQTYENGVLIYEEYLYTTCSCMGGGGGGGGPTNPPTGESCNLTVQEATEILNAMSGVETYEHTAQATSGMMINENTQFTTQAFSYRWDFFDLHYILNYYTHWSAYYNGIRYKENNNAQWKWQSFHFSNASKRSGEAPLCMYSLCFASSPTSIRPDGKASATLSYTIKTYCSCIGGTLLPGTITNSITDNEIEPY